MTIGVVSDVHLEYLSPDEKRAFLEFLERCSAYDSLVINGDLFDAPPDPRRRAFPENIDVAEKLVETARAGVPTTYVVGNHDIAMSALVMRIEKLNLSVAYPSHETTVGTVRVLFEHGHAYDPFYASRLYDVARLIEEVSGFDPGETAVRAIERLLEPFRTSQRTKLGVPRAALKLWEEAAIRQIEKGYDVIVMGHTHEPQIVEYPGGVYVNSGSWLENRTYVEITEDAVRLMAWQRNRPLGEARLAR
jgi:UDP-2,3-diacylglucosamine hydrolase